MEPEGSKVVAGAPRPAAELDAALRAEGLDPFGWSNPAGHEYAPHDHPHESVIVCVRGSVTFHVGGRDVELGPGDRLDLGAGVEHAATVGPDGVECLEATIGGQP